MEKRKIEKYEEGYSSGEVVKKLTAAASALLLCGGLTACHRSQPEPDNSIMGEEQYLPAVSESDFSSDDALTLDGEERYYSVEKEMVNRDYLGNMTVEPSEGD